MKRRIVSIAAIAASDYNEGMIVAVANDGTAWTQTLSSRHRRQWQSLPALPDAPDYPLPPHDPRLAEGGAS